MKPLTAVTDNDAKLLDRKTREVWSVVRDLKAYDAGCVITNVLASYILSYDKDHREEAKHACLELLGNILRREEQTR